MKRNGIIAAGNWIVDHVKTIDRFPAVGELCNIVSHEISGGGGPCNVLFDLAAMQTDIPLYAVGRLGDDDSGKYLLRESEQRGINTDFLFIDKQLPTSYTNVMSGQDRRTFFHCRGANAALSFEDFEAINVPGKIFYLGYLLLLDALDSADAQYGTAGAKVLHTMQQKGMLTVVDFVSEAPEKFKRVVRASLPYIDVLVINEIEAGNTFDVKIRRSDDSLDLVAMKQVAEKFIDSGVKNMVVFHYPEGAMVLRNGEKSKIFSSLPLGSNQIKGTNGAGDAFCAGILYGLHEDLSVDEMVSIANVSAVFNLSSPTASGGAVSLERIKEYLNQ